MIFRKAKGRENPYAIISKAILNNKALSWEARGMLAYLLGKPDDWQISMVDLQRRSPAGLDKTRRIIGELEAAGYVRREKRHDTAKGTWVWESMVYEEPVFGSTIEGKPIDGEGTDIPSIEFTKDPPDRTSSRSVLREAQVPTPIQESKPKPKRRTRTRDPRTRHPAIQCYRGIVGKLPSKALYDDLIGTLGNQPDGALAARCYKTWVSRGFNPQACTPFLEWYRDGIPERGNGQPRASPVGAPPTRLVKRTFRNSFTGESVEAEVPVSDGPDTS